MSAVESLGKYEIRRELGRGAVGTVYEGFDPIIERTVAIKTVRLPAVDDDETAGEISRFRREAQAAGRLSHPNIVGVFDYGETADLAYIVMEYVDGPSLKSLLDQHERFPLAMITRIMEDLLAGLQFSHERGVVHRDIKPANLMLTKSGQAKIADFGIARIESSSMTRAGTVLGTPAYMSPEQFMGQLVDARSDIYSSGVLLYQLLTGERPFEGSMSAIMHKALHTEPPLPSQISVTSPPAFDAVVKRAMAKRPDDRYSSATEFMAAISAAAAAPLSSAETPDDDGDATMVSPAGPGIEPGVPTSNKVKPPIPAPARPKKSSKLRVAVVAGVASLAILAGAGYVLVTGDLIGPERSPEPAKPTSESTPPEVAAPTPPPPEPVPQTTIPPHVPPPATAELPVLPPATTQPTELPITPAPALPPAIVPPAATPGPVVLVPPPAVAPPVTPPAGATSGTPSGTSGGTPPHIIPRPDPSERIRAEVAAFALRLPCSMLDGDVVDGAVQVAGIAGGTPIDDLRQKLVAMGLTNPPPSLRITQVGHSFCPWEDLLRPIAKTFGEGGNRLTLRLPGDPAWLRKDDFIRPRVVMADFKGELIVDYLDREGNVQHLYPTLGDPARNMDANPSRVFAPGEVLNLGDPGPGNPGWQVDEPYGTDVIIAIASAQPLFDQPRPANVEKATAYLRDLRRAVEASWSRGLRLTATATALETRPK
jgi:eukaryotic-like serine/threonine-protein kinase